MARPDLAQQSTADLVRLASDQLTSLVRDEMRLARAEMTEKGKRAGMAAGAFGAAGVVALYAGAAFATALILALDLAMPAWLAALIVGVVLLIVAGVLALIGRKEVRRAVPPVPEEAVGSVRADIDALTTAVEERGRR